MKFAFLLFSMVTIFSGIFFNAIAQVSPVDSLALVDLYNGTGGPGWINNNNWLTASPVSTWSGVIVSGGRVISLRMAANNLTGSIPSSIGNLSGLDTLVFISNKFSGSIPASLGQLSSLQYLFLFGDSLTGAIPVELGNLSNLTTCIFSNNQLSGPIPSSLGNLSKLRQLYLDQNNLSGAIPASLGNIPNLYDLYLQINSLSGTLPASLGNLGRLVHLVLGANNLTGTIPSSFANLSSLSLFSVSFNNLQGDLSAIAGLPLSALSVEQNHFSGPVPFFSGNLLNGSFLSDNSFTFDGMENIAQRYPSALYSPQADIPIRTSGNVLSVSSGGSPSFTTYTWYLNGIQVAQKRGDTTFTKTSPGVYIVKVTNSVANKLILYGIDTTNGKVKDSLALVDFYNSTNGPKWLNNTNWLTSSPLDTWYGITLDANTHRVTRLALNGNRLEGPIPASIGNLLDVTYIDFSANGLTDTLPATLMNLLKLDSVNLFGGYLTGKIPFASAPLQLLNLSANKFNFTALEDVVSRYPIAKYDWQMQFSFSATNNFLSVSAGGTLANNTYRWYRNNVLIATKTADSTLTITNPGSYYVTITNSLANATVLNSLWKDIYFNTHLVDTTMTVSKYIGGDLPVNVNDTAYNRVLTIAPTAGLNELVGNVNSLVTIDSTVNLFMNQPYLQRHFDVTPTDNAENAKATLTLYFTQQEFNNFNSYVTANNLNIPLLPIDGVDNGNVRIMQLHGSFTGTSNPANYQGSTSFITPVTVWDSVNTWWTVTFPVTGFSGFFVSTINFALPLNLLQFTGVLQDNAVHLAWLTSAEVNTKQFMVEKSQDGISFSSIGTVAALSNSGNHAYQFTDLNTKGSKSFYRLKMFDKDNHFTLSKVIVIKTGNSIAGLSVYPNPVTTNTNIVFFTSSPIKYSVSITEMDGKILQSFNATSVPGKNLFCLKVSDYAKGNYLITLSDKENGKRTVQFNKR